MANIRNPFKLRAAEQISNPSQFLHLFDPHVLNIITTDWFVEKVHFINSSPGAGKSSLLRIFSPDILSELHNTGRANPEYKEIFSKLNKLNAISNTGPELLGIGISCSGNLKSLKDCAFNSQMEEKLLFTLLSSRLILSMLHGVMVLKDLSSTEELNDLKILNPKNPNFFSSESIPNNGRDLFQWADNIEKNACELIDSLDTISDISMKIPDISNAIFLLKAENLKFNDESLVEKTLIMLDDFHELPVTQRNTIKKYLYKNKFPICFWIAQRVEGINPKELLCTNISAGAIEGREYDNVFLEAEWRKRFRGYIIAYENVLSNIADKRINISNYKEISSFRDCLKDSLNDKKWENKYEKISSEISQRVTEKVKSSKKYSRWLTEIERLNDEKESLQQKAIAWRSLEILISRAEKKGQLTLENEFLNEQLALEKDVDILKNYAHLFLAREYDIPYYFGFSKLSEISSSNFEQFLAFSADLFEEAISSHTIKKNSFVLAPSRQEQIIKAVAEKNWQEIPKRIPHGEEIQYFLEKFCQFAVSETYNSTASYPPGITGFSIVDDEYEILIESIKDEKNLGFTNLGYLIYICLSNNLFQMTPNINQGGKSGHKFYLNRWICVKFGLPLGYGGWRWKRIEELARWSSPRKSLVGKDRQIYDEFSQ